MVIVSKEGIDYSDLEFFKANNNAKEKSKEIEMLCKQLETFLNIKYTMKQGKLEKYDIPVERLMCLIRFMAAHPHVKMMCDQMIGHINFKSEKINYVG